MKKLLLTAAAMAALGAAAPAIAQTATHDGAVLTFAPTHFASYNPVTALDMVQQVPGFSIDNGAQVRGLADTFANVLIDGERQSTKSESINQILSRIPAGNVERIEFIREAVAGVDMRGQSRVVNVVLSESEERSGNAEIGFDYWAGSGAVTPAFDLSSTWEMDDTRITLGARFDQNAAPFLRDEWLEDVAGALIETRDERTSRLRTAPSVSGTFNTRFDDESRLNLSLNASYVDSRTTDRSLVDDAAGAPSRVELFNSLGEETSWEATLTYERPFGEDLSGQLVFLNRDETSDYQDDFTYAPYIGNRSTTFFDNQVDSGERALRGTLTWEMNERHSLEVGAETALNYLENALAIQEDTGSGPVAVALPVANTRIEETRSEVFASHVWRPNSDITLESGFRFERSTIEQTGDASRERSFNYPKPSVTLTWDASENTQWSFSLEREVAQLSFGEFASAVDPRENQIALGNPELEPQKTWRLNARWERRWGEEGSLVFSLTHEEVEDVQDQRPITVITDDTTVPPSTRTFDAPGNIGDGQRTYLWTTLTLPLDDFGIEDARLFVNALLRTTDVTDPTTGEARRFQGNEDWGLYAEYRQNLPDHDLAWGGNIYTQGIESVSRFNQELDYTVKTPQFDLWVETTAIEGWTVRATLGDLISPSVRGRERTFFDGSRANGVVTRREYREQDLGGFVSVRARRSF